MRYLAGISHHNTDTSNHKLLSMFPKRNQLSLFIKLSSLFVCLFLCLVITQEPLDRFASNFDWVTLQTLSFCHGFWVIPVGQHAFWLKNAGAAYCRLVQRMIDMLGVEGVLG